MKFKLDENLGQSALERFAGYDCSTVRLQGLGGATDARVFEVCAGEGRVLVTCDLDFANPYTYDPRPGPGVAVLRLPVDHGPSDIHAALTQLLAAVQRHDITGALWIVRRERIRVWQPD